MYYACALKDNVKAACTPEKMTAPVKNIRLTVEDKINTRNLYELNQRVDRLA